MRHCHWQTDLSCAFRLCQLAPLAPHVQICTQLFIYLFTYLFVAVQFLINSFDFLAAARTLYAISCLAVAKLK